MVIVEPDYILDLEFDAVTHTYQWRGVLLPHITEIVPSDYSHVPHHYLERARQRGSDVHKATEEYDLRILDWSTLKPSVLPYLEAWIKFKGDYELECEDCDVERRLFHPVHRYAGTGDRPRCWLTPPGQSRRLVTLEIKTIAQMDENVMLQTAGQQAAENHRARILGIPETTERWAVQLKKNGGYKEYPYGADPYHTRVFLGYLTTLNWEVYLGKRSYAKQGSSPKPNGHNTLRFQRFGTTARRR